MSKPDLFNVPLKALGQDSLYRLSLQLNSEKIIQSDDGHLRDWRGLAQMVGLLPQDITAMSYFQDPFSQVIRQWSKISPDVQRETANLGTLKILLGELDRWDVVDDTEKLLEKDAEMFYSNLELSQAQVENTEDILTEDDLSMPNQMYHSLLLFAEADKVRAKEILNSLEGRGLKICVKERDLLPGVMEHGAMLKLIAERCNTVIAIMSEAFLNTNQNKFFISYAQSVGIERNSRKLIPVIYENCKIPPELSYCFRLVFTNDSAFYNFYDKLFQSVCPIKPASAYRSEQQIVAPRARVPRHEAMSVPEKRMETSSSVSLCDANTNSESGYISEGSSQQQPEKSKSKKSIKTRFFNKFTKKKKSKVALQVAA